MSFQENTINPTPEIAGLLSNIERINTNHLLFKDPVFIEACKKLKTAIPEIPIIQKNGKRIIFSAKQTVKQKYNYGKEILHSGIIRRIN